MCYWYFKKFENYENLQITPLCQIPQCVSRWRVLSSKEFTDLFKFFFCFRPIGGHHVPEY